MRDPGELFELNPALQVPEGLPLVAGLTGFADAGSGVSQLGTYLLGTLDSEVVATFDADILLDYRARRPIIYFDQDHLTDYQPATLKLYLAYDELRQPFLLLSGFEPDFRWEAFTDAVLGLIERFKVKSITWVHAIPMPVPHTRPIGVTVSGNRTELIESMSIWKPHTQVPANALHLLEYRLQKLSYPIAGFILLIPHYLADTEYPAAAVAALDSISAATALIFPTDRLRQEDRDFIANIDEQVAGNAELGRLVGTLEERHDSYMEDTQLRSPLTDSDGELPSADEIAAELENFLAFRRHGDEENPRGER
ncbi:proteasome assembly chaperone family protein [Leifsonia sp. 2TAF2]|uniref:proteasome assembly chaperone family protein n=1 Tax=Leifsonia sp. 2TAF2 TaxID=3233009 RepID=UPI003F9B0044